MSAQAPSNRASSSSEPTAPTIPPVDAGSVDVTEIRRWVFLLVGLGITWRVVRYALGFPFWGDEAYLNTNYFCRDTFELMLPLEYAQVAPIGFLWIQKWIFNTFGGGEYALRAVPLLAGILALLMFSRLAWGMLLPRGAAIAIGFFAGAYYLVRHSVESKQYATDLFMAVALLAVGAFWLERVRSRDRALLAAVVAVFGIWLSLPAVFVAGGIGLVAGLRVLIEREWRALGWCAGYGLAILVSFLLLYVLVIKEQSAAATGTWLEYYWRESFPPRDVLGFLKWLVVVHTGRMGAYPFGGANWGSAGTAVLALFGAFWLIRSGRWMAVALLATPAMLGIVAALLHKYPYGGSLRVTIYMAPAYCLLAGSGGAFLIDQVLAAKYRDFVGGALGAVLVAMPFGGGLYDVLNPYKELKDPYVRSVVRESIGQDFAHRDLVGIHNPMMGEHTGPDALDGPMFDQSLRYYLELETGIRPQWREANQYSREMQYIFVLHGVWEDRVAKRFEANAPTWERVAGGAARVGLSIELYREYEIVPLEDLRELDTRFKQAIPKLVVYRCKPLQGAGISE